MQSARPKHHQRALPVARGKRHLDVGPSNENNSDTQPVEAFFRRAQANHECAHTVLGGKKRRKRQRAQGHVRASSSRFGSMRTGHTDAAGRHASLGAGPTARTSSSGTRAPLPQDRWRWKQWRRNAPRFTLCVGPRYISKLTLWSDKDAMVCVMVEKLVVVVVDYDVY